MKYEKLFLDEGGRDIVTKDGIMVAKVFGRDDAHEREVGKLLAAAPDLMAALKKIAAGGEGDSVLEKWASMFDEACAAIARAEGKEISADRHEEAKR